VGGRPLSVKEGSPGRKALLFGEDQSASLWEFSQAAPGRHRLLVPPVEAFLLQGKDGRNTKV